MRHSLLTLALAALALPGSPLQAGKVRRQAPKARPHSKAKTASMVTHVVQKGDTAASIARAEGLGLSELQALNPGLRLSRLSIGMVVVVGRRAPAGASAATSTETLSPQAAVTTPLSPLPALPRLGVGALPHLEKLLPVMPRLLAPSPEGPQSAVPETPERLMGRLQPILPPLDKDESGPNADLGFMPVDPDAMDLLWPVETRTISSNWGPRMRTKVVRTSTRKKKRVRYRGRHRGLDLNAPQGTLIFAAMDGRVVVAGKHRQYGNYVMVEHGNGVTTLYAHASRLLVNEGDIVHRGEVLGHVGRTGNATGPHLHFELRVNGEHRNPLPMLNEEDEVLLADERAAGTL